MEIKTGLLLVGVALLIAWAVIAWSRKTENWVATARIRDLREMLEHDYVLWGSAPAARTLIGRYLQMCGEEPGREARMSPALFHETYRLMFPITFPVSAAVHSLAREEWEERFKKQVKISLGLPDDDDQGVPQAELDAWFEYESADPEAWLKFLPETAAMDSVSAWV